MKRASDHFAADNLLAARIYLRDPERYEFGQKWARMVLERIEGRDGDRVEDASPVEDETAANMPMAESLPDLRPGHPRG